MNYPSKSPLPLIDDFRSIVVENRPLIDTRAPVEFAKGAFPNAVNLPLMNDEERERVGTRYKQKGHDAAVALGHKLVGGEIRKTRIRAWLDCLEKHPDAYIYCWRGGQRSQIVQQWIHETSGKAVPRLKGGYKAFRHYLMEESLRLARQKEVLILGGRTGSGKTLLIEKIPEAIDLEGIAHHRGSAFGRYAHSQPSQIDFENALAYAQIRHDAAEHPFLLIEDESRNIGQRYIPTEVFQAFQRGKVLLLETPLEERIEISYQDYILFAQKEYDEAYARGEAPYDWYETMRHNFRRIRKRLGNERYERYLALLEAAWEEQQRSGATERHKVWIRALLEEYYDPMYDYQIEKKKDRIIFRGNAEEILEFLKRSHRVL
ncbi:tRNA 2-selenouridine(34) synthase MnmH [Nitratifractor sp.]